MSLCASTVTLIPFNNLKIVPLKRRPRQLQPLVVFQPHVERCVSLCRPEINVRDTAFKRGTAYLERYCLLIAFTSYLERTKGSDITFQACLFLSILHSAALNLQMRLCAIRLYNRHESSSNCKCTYTSLVIASAVNSPAGIIKATAQS